jgi:hypothetical protein
MIGMGLTPNAQGRLSPFEIEQRTGLTRPGITTFLMRMDLTKGHPKASTFRNNNKSTVDAKVPLLYFLGCTPQSPKARATKSLLNNMMKELEPTTSPSSDKSEAQRLIQEIESLTSKLKALTL